MSIYLAARDLANVPIGTHQFIIIVIKSNPYPKASLNGNVIPPKNLGKGNIGYVIGAQNRGNLEVEFFENSDFQATLEYFDKSKTHFYKSDFDTQVKLVKFPGKSSQQATREILRLISAYHTNQTMDKIKYPTAGIGFNSNSWAQSVIQLAGGKVDSDMSGLDISHDKRIPKTYFDPVCLPYPRPTLN